MKILNGKHAHLSGLANLAKSLTQFTNITMIHENIHLNRIPYQEEADEELKSLAALDTA